MLAHHFQFMARHHKHCTRRLVQYLDAAQRRNLGDAFGCRGSGCLFFGSVQGTLNHLAGAELLWYSRLTGEQQTQATAVADLYGCDGEELQRRWETYITDQEELKSVLKQQCDKWSSLVSGSRGVNSSMCLPTQATSHGNHHCDPVTDLERWLLTAATYKDTSGCERSVCRAAALAQVFHHASHHRGQISAALHWWQSNGGPTESELPLPSMDMQGLGTAFLAYEA
jgi:uncharacterized damage-inducible protein DinB